MSSMRIGEGWDIHQLVAGRPLVLGGVTIAHSHGLLGHSDADVLLHAVTDALLGGAGLGDIGRHFQVDTHGLPNLLLPLPDSHDRLDPQFVQKNGVRMRFTIHRIAVLHLFPACRS